MEVKIETDSNDAVEIKTEADSNDITECQHDDRPSMFALFSVCITRIHSLLPVSQSMLAKGTVFCCCPLFFTIKHVIFQLTK